MKIFQKHPTNEVRRLSSD